MSQEKLADSKESDRRTRLLIKMTGLSYKEFGETHGISLSTLNTWIYGLNTELSEKAAQRMIDAARKSGIHASVNWLMYGYGPQPQMGNMAYTSASPDKSVTPSEYDPQDVFNREMQFFCDNHPDAVTAIVSDNGMEPIYLMGDCVGGKFLYESNIPKAFEKDCIIKTIDNDILCRHLTAGSRDGLFNLYVVNPRATVQSPIMQDVLLVAAAPIIRLWRREEN